MDSDFFVGSFCSVFFACAHVGSYNSESSSFLTLKVQGQDSGSFARLGVTI